MDDKMNDNVTPLRTNMKSMATHSREVQKKFMENLLNVGNPTERVYASLTLAVGASLSDAIHPYMEDETPVDNIVSGVAGFLAQQMTELIPARQTIDHSIKYSSINPDIAWLAMEQSLIESFNRALINVLGQMRNLPIPPEPDNAS